jgi:hypothetical protein
VDNMVGFGKADNSPWIAFECPEKSLPKLFRYGCIKRQPCISG